MICSPAEHLMQARLGFRVKGLIRAFTVQGYLLRQSQALPSSKDGSSCKMYKKDKVYVF